MNGDGVVCGWIPSWPMDEEVSSQADRGTPVGEHPPSRIKTLRKMKILAIERANRNAIVRSNCL